jgi:hypothetical protein
MATRIRAKPGPKGGKKTKSLRLTIPARVFDYLGWLSRNTQLGADENDVAETVLRRRLENMRQRGYRDPPLTEERDELDLEGD